MRKESFKNFTSQEHLRDNNHEDIRVRVEHLERQEPYYDALLDEELLEQVGREKNRPDLKSFEGVLSSEAIEKDEKLVENRKKQWTKNAEELPEDEAHRDNLEKKRADALEVACALLDEQLWYDGARTVHASEYDDFENGCDMVLEFENDIIETLEDLSKVAISIDITSGKGSLEDKISKNIRSIKNGSGKNIKYYESATENAGGEPLRGSVTVHTPMVLALDGNKADSLIEHMAKLITSEGIWKTKKTKQRNNDLSVERPATEQEITLHKERWDSVNDSILHDPLQISFLEQILAQSEFYLRNKEHLGLSKEAVEELEDVTERLAEQKSFVEQTIKERYKKRGVQENDIMENIESGKDNTTVKMIKEKMEELF
ncbi:MAG: hypothetical protein WDZ39_00860 [Candidatus Spechtbacterales bacterium]